MSERHTLELHGLCKSFGGTVAIDDFNADWESIYGKTSIPELFRRVGIDPDAK